MKEFKINERINLRGEICPYNFVKTKLKLEEMQSGQILEVILDEGEPIRNVPRSVKEEGHRILQVARIGGSFRLIVEKR